MQTSLVFRNNDSQPLSSSEIDDNFEFLAGRTVTRQLANAVATAADTNPVSLTDLIFTYEANATYRIWAMGRVTPATVTTGLGLQFDLSSVVTSIDLQYFHARDSVGALTGGHSIADAASAVVTTGVPASLSVPVTMFGILVTTENKGTAQLQLRSEVADIVTAEAGFLLVVERFL